MSHITILAVPVFSPLCNLGFALRREVFVLEQNIVDTPEFDDDDLTATHVVAIVDGAVVGVLRIIAAPEHMKIGRVVVSQAARGRGVSTKLLDFAMELCRKVGRDRFWLSAQADKLRVYEKLGFVGYGEPYDDGSGIMHLSMKTY